MARGKLTINRQTKDDVKLPHEIIDGSCRYYPYDHPTLKQQSWLTKFMRFFLPTWRGSQTFDAIREDRLPNQLKNVHEKNMGEEKSMAEIEAMINADEQMGP